MPVFRKAVRRHAEYMRWKLVEIYREEGVSGYKRERPALGRMIADAEAGRFDVAVFPSLDRPAHRAGPTSGVEAPGIARSVKDSIEIEKCFRDCGVSVVFVRENIDTATAVGEFFRNVMSSIAEFEGHLMHERMLGGLRAKAARGGYTGTWLPYGYEAVDGEVVVVLAQAVVVRGIFEWRAEGRSLRRMANELNATSIPTQHGRKWHPSVAWEIYRNRFYTGKSKAGGGWVDGQHEAVVPEDIFRKANAHNRKAG